MACKAFGNRAFISCLEHWCSTVWITVDEQFWYQRMSKSGAGCVRDQGKNVEKQLPRGWKGRTLCEQEPGKRPSEVQFRASFFVPCILAQDCEAGVIVAFWMRNLCVLYSEFRGCSSETKSVSRGLVRPIKSCANHLGFWVEWWLDTMVMNSCLLPESCVGKYLHRRKKDTFIWNLNIYFKFLEYVISKHYPPTEHLPSILTVLLSWILLKA